MPNPNRKVLEATSKTDLQNVSRPRDKGTFQIANDTGSCMAQVRLHPTFKEYEGAKI